MNQRPAFGSRHLRLTQGKMAIYAVSKIMIVFSFYCQESPVGQGLGDGKPKLCRLENFCFYL